MDGTELRMHGMVEEVLGTTVNELKKQLGGMKMELEEARLEILELKSVADGSQGGLRVAADTGVWPKPGEAAALAKVKAMGVRLITLL